MSRAHIVSPTELRLQQFLKTKPRVAPPVIATLLRLDEWTRSIHAGEAESPLRRKLIARASAPDPIRQIAENLIEHANGIERDFYRAVFVFLLLQLCLVPHRRVLSSVGSDVSGLRKGNGKRRKDLRE